MDLKKYIIENYYTKTYQELADELGVKLNTIEECIKKMMDLGMLESKTKRWTKKEEKFIIENLANYTTEEFAKIYKVQIEQMRKKIYYLKKKLKRIEPNKIIKVKEVKRDYGLNNRKYTLKLNLGQSYRITKNEVTDRAKDNKHFIGKFIQETENLIVFKGNYVESFLKKDCLLGGIEVKELVK